MPSRNGTLNGSDQNAAPETLTAQAHDHRAEHARTRPTGSARRGASPIPPAVSAPVTIARRTSAVATRGLHEADRGGEVEGLDQAGLHHRRADAERAGSAGRCTGEWSLRGVGGRSGGVGGHEIRRCHAATELEMTRRLVAIRRERGVRLEPCHERVALTRLGYR